MIQVGVCTRMPYQKVKTEQYSNVGGINEKASIYKTGENEVLGLVNYDFSEPGAWTKRPGITNTIDAGNTLTIGASQTLNQLWSLNKSAYNFPVGTTAGAGNTFALQNFYRHLFAHGNGIFKVTSAVTTTPNTTFIYQNLITGMTSANWNYVNYQNVSYMAPGGRLFKYSPTIGTTFVGGSSVALFTLIDNAFYWGMAYPSFLSINSSITAGTTLSGTYTYQFAYKDFLGFIGPRSGTYFFGASVGANSIVMSGFTSGNGISYGYQSTAVFRDRVPGFANTDLVLLTSFTGATFVDNGLYSGIDFEEPVVQLNNLPLDDYYLSSNILELYENRIFYDVNSSYQISDFTDLNITNETPYRIYFSEIGEPQKIFPENFIQISSNSQPITALKSFNQSLVIFCNEGVFRLTGDNPDNFNLNLITDEFGCISHKAVVEFKNRLWFLDDIGIVEYTGSSYDQVSNRMTDTFNSMNVDAARQTAVACHVPERNEVWFAIPVGTSTVNNLVVVYDYLANGWTTFSGDLLKPTALNPIYKEMQVASQTFAATKPINKVYMFGSIGASLYNFHPSLTSDNGGAITLSYQTRWHESFGKSSTNQFRRYFLDTKITDGATQTFNQTFALSFYANYASTTISLTRAFNTSTLTENWIDFGIPAKSLSVRNAYGSTTGTVKVYGYTVESRYQRNK